MSATSWDIVIVGGAYTDYVVRGQRLPTPGETVLGQELLILPGSKASNQAVAAARLGAHVTLVTQVGADARGDEIITGLRKEGVDTRYIRRDSSTPTGISLIQVDEHGHKQMMVAPGACHHLPAEAVMEAKGAIKATKILLTQLEVPLETVMTAVRLGCDAGKQVIFDPAPAQPVPNQLLCMVDIIKPDAKEAQALTGITVNDRNTARKAALELLKHGIKVVAIQAGTQGDLLIWHGGECWLPRIPVKSVDTTGAGDAFIAALSVALAEDRPLNEAGFFASATAALTTTMLGARPALPRRDDVMALLVQLQHMKR